MADSVEEKIKKVRTLYERTTNPGEKAAAYEALKRLLHKDDEETTPGANWLEDMQAFLLSKGFYLCGITGNSYLYSKVRQRDGEKIRLNRLSRTKGTWVHFKASSGRKFVFTDRRPDNTGNSKEQLSRIMI